MEEINYIGEHLLPGQIGKAAIFIAFLSAVLAFVSYFFATQRRDTDQYQSWRKLGRISYITHGLAIFSTIGIIFYVMVNHYYEYSYVQAHVNEDLPFRYIFSAFWEGQEGSFLLWMFWHVVLGFILIRKAKTWETPVLAVIAGVEILISSMILGIYLPGEIMKIGSNPMLLIRDTMDIPIFQNADYVSMIQGSGLNPLLQNYWMTIHPPTLFLGFASTIVPFAYAIAGLWTNRHKEWLVAVAPWALFSGGILGTGILMGGAWAYEALNFGGYWAWDPVENMSLVPWLILVAGIHTNLIARATGYSIKSTYLFYILTFGLIVYSTFLTRSGVLGETSVHAFTEMGLETQLLVFLAASFLGGLIPFFMKLKDIPSPEREEKVESREFWMFIGALVLAFSGAMITASTSLPVFNEIASLFNENHVDKTILDPIGHYNQYQLWIAVFMGLISGFSQFLRWKGTNWSSYKKTFAKHALISLAGAIVMTLVTKTWLTFSAWQYFLLLLMGIYTVIANLDYLIFFLRGNLKIGSSAISHMGFGIMIVGIMASSLNKQHISTNPFQQRGLLDESLLGKNVFLFKGMPAIMNDFKVTYMRDSFHVNDRVYDVKFERFDLKTGEILEEFTLNPTVLYDNKVTKVSSYTPSTKHYLHKDIFAHIASIAGKEADIAVAKETEDSLKYKMYNVPFGQDYTILDTVPVRDTTIIRPIYVKITDLDYSPKHENYEALQGDIAVGVNMELQDKYEDTTYAIQPVLVLRKNLLYYYPEQVNDLSKKFKISEDFVEQLYTPEQLLNYQDFVFKQGSVVEINGYKVQFTGVEQEVSHPDYIKEENDIAVCGKLKVLSPSGKESIAKPVLIIRNKNTFFLKDELREEGLHFVFGGIDPEKGEMKIKIAHNPVDLSIIPIGVAQSPRTDFIVLEAILFPGINLFWLGSIAMLLGLFLGIWNRKILS